jgi:hypothetical protein
MSKKDMLYYYNDIIKLNESSELNSVNFLESLIYINNLKKLLNIIYDFEKDINLEIKVLPSFKGKTFNKTINSKPDYIEEENLTCLHFYVPNIKPEIVYNLINENKNNLNYSKLIYDNEKLTLFL